MEHIGSYCASVWKWLRGSPAVGKNLALLIEATCFGGLSLGSGDGWDSFTGAGEDPRGFQITETRSRGFGCYCTICTRGGEKRLVDVVA